MLPEFLTPQSLSPKARDLVSFDMDSVRQAAAGRRAAAPDVWLADPAEYEHDGRVLRDSTSPRLLGYSVSNHILYANDGCNSCIHDLTAPLESATQAQLREIAEAFKIRTELVVGIAQLARTQRL